MAKNPQELAPAAIGADITLPRTSLPKAATFLALALAVPSIGVAYKFGRLPGLILYLISASAGIAFLAAWGYPRVLSRISNSRAHALMALTIVVLTIGLLLIYPLNQAHVFGAGNDEADGMNIAVTNLLHGRYPYIGHTWAGNPIVPWPGSVFLATPFVLLGNSAYQVIFWLALLYVTIAWYMGRGAAAALTLIWSIIGFSPVFLDYFWSGSDVVAAAMFVTTAALVTVKSARANSRWHLLAAAGLGVAFSSRANFVLAYPAVAAALYGARGLRPAIVSGLVTGGCFVAVTVPFLFADFANFTPLTSRTTILLALSPGAPAVIVAVSVATIISVLLLGRFWDWLVSASLMLAVPVVAVVALALRAHGAIGLNSYPDYGITYEFFAVVVAGRLVLDGAMAHFSPTSTSIAR